jgi:hypothetical protein
MRVATVTDLFGRVKTAPGRHRLVGCGVGFGGDLLDKLLGVTHDGGFPSAYVRRSVLFARQPLAPHHDPGRSSRRTRMTTRTAAAVGE